MVSLPLISLLLLLTTVLTSAGPIYENPWTPIGVTSKLNRRNPAYGGPPIRGMIAPILRAVHLGRALETNVSHSHRALESTSSDVKRLESYFGVAMEANVKTIQQKYARASYSPVPWPSSYWPNYLDSINYKWTNEMSPAEKYARAFGLDVQPFMDTVSKQLGVDLQASDSRRACSDDNQCTRFGDDSVCAKRDGNARGYCVPMWYGICHGMASAAIMEPEPRCDVVKNGVTFHAFDIKGLMSAIYDGGNVSIVFTGARYDGAGSDRDEYGRFKDAAERDLGPGFFHIAVTNIMGRFGKSFIVDVNADAQIWNQPVWGYEIRKVLKMTPSAAAQTYFNVPKYPFNKNAKAIAYVEMGFRYINEYIQDGPLVETGIVDKATVTRDYFYLLELDATDNIIGGEWIYGSQTNHPDFLWFATQKPSLDKVTALGLSYKNVQELLQQSVACGSNGSKK